MTHWKIFIHYLVTITIYCIMFFLICFLIYHMDREHIQKSYQTIPEQFALQTEQQTQLVNAGDNLRNAIELARTDKNERELAKQQEEEQELLRESLKAPELGNHYADIIIERIGMNVPLYYGDSNAILKKGAGQYTGSTLPGGGSQILACAHNTTHFKPLQHVVLGDIIRVVTNYGEFQYKVTNTRIASMNDRTTYNFKLPYEQLLIYTCYPFTGPPGKTERFFVYADLIE